MEVDNPLGITHDPGRDGGPSDDPLPPPGSDGQAPKQSVLSKVLGPASTNEVGQRLVTICDCLVANGLRLEGEQSKLGDQQSKLGDQQSKLGDQQSKLRDEVSDLRVRLAHMEIGQQKQRALVSRPLNLVGTRIGSQAEAFVQPAWNTPNNAEGGGVGRAVLAGQFREAAIDNNQHAQAEPQPSMEARQREKTRQMLGLCPSPDSSGRGAQQSGDVNEDSGPPRVGVKTEGSATV